MAGSSICCVRFEITTVGFFGAAGFFSPRFTRSCSSGFSFSTFLARLMRVVLTFSSLATFSASAGVQTLGMRLVLSGTIARSLDAHPALSVA